MAAFSSYHSQRHSLFTDSVFFPDIPTQMSGFSEEPNITSTTFFTQFYHSDPPQEIPVDVSVRESSTKAVLSNNDSSSVVVDKLESGEQVTQKVISMDKKRKCRDGPFFNSAQSKDTREVRGKKQKQRNGAMIEVEEKQGRTDKKDQKKVPEEAPTGYIHVRARRGQATDSHSLAERVRREKISERMKLLQGLVPGCDKVSGKAMMLDEIINYVQSLQNQVEFLSMKLASVNPVFYDFGMDLDAFMVNPERVNGLASPMPNVQQCSPTQATNTFTAANSYPLLDSSASLAFQQQHMPNILSQSNGQLLWDVHNDHRQYF